MGMHHRVIHILRTIHAKLRRHSLRFLGINELVTHNLLVGPAVDIPVGEAFQRLMDRICILESHVNWRLYGLPATVGNIKLEQTGILANSLDLEQLVAKLANLFARQNEAEMAQSLCVSQKGLSLVVASAGLRSLTKSNCDVVLDTEDLYLPAYEAQFKEGVGGQRFLAPVLSVLAATPHQHYDGVWLSNLCERMQPLKALLVMKHAVRVTKRGGVVAGYLSNQPGDPRIVKVFDLTLFKHLDLGGNVEMNADGSFKIKCS